MDQNEELKNKAEPVNLAEVKALLQYATDQGLDPQGTITRPLMDAVQTYEFGTLPPTTLQSADDEGPERGATREAGRQSRTDIMVRYGQLTELTKPVTGRSVMDTVGPSWKLLWPLYLTCAVILVLVLANESLNLWIGEDPEPEDLAPAVWIVNFHRYVLEVLEPFLWGALGSCVYLLKRLSDFTEARCYDETISSGWATRILLGAILGGVVQVIYDPTTFTAGGLQLKAGALGFLTGVGVKVVYGAIEKTISVLGEKLNLDSVRKVDPGSDAIRIFLTKQLAREEIQNDLMRRDLITGMLTDLKTTGKEK
ncbi:hypothetical protein ACG02S_24180 [Roseateles sp. DC23W]|uniref:Uncharacterized protein n=1 Tax=Pelomonas dachongensis TaxID=3299029 RepID=A0ABW7EU43_9BURK